MQIYTEVRDGVKFFVFHTANLDFYHRKEVESLFVAVGDEKVVAFDLAEVQFVDSSMLGVFLSGQKILASRACAFVVFGLTPRVMGMFKLTRLEYVIPVLKSKEEVLEMPRESEPE
jgi:anti-anti-sigma factor